MKAPKKTPTLKGAKRSIHTKEMNESLSEYPELLFPGKLHVSFDEYMGSKVITLATFLRRSTAIRYRHMYRLSMVESRAILKIRANEPLSLDALADELAISKSQASRVVTALVNRKLVEREKDPNHARNVLITLADDGRVLEESLIEDAKLHHDELVSDLSPADLARLSSILDKLLERARTLLQVDQAEFSRKAKPALDADEVAF